MMSYEVTCGRFTRSYRVKSTWYAEFEIKKDGKKTHVSRSFTHLKIKNDSMLHKYECIKLAYSNYINSNIRIIDNRVGKEWLWFLKKEDR